MESDDEMVMWNVYQWIINFNIGKRHAHEVVKCNVDHWSNGSAKGSDVKGMVVVAHSRQSANEILRKPISRQELLRNPL